MTVSTTKFGSLHEEKTKSDHDHIPSMSKPVEAIRQRVEDRHWQLFEARLKNQLPEVNKETYTNPNDYRIIDRFKRIDHSQPPIEPSRRWETFCNQITNKSNEINRLISIFHHVWLTNWNTKQINETIYRQIPDQNFTENAFLDLIATTENDRNLISSILHQTTFGNVSSAKDKEYVT